ncbi:MAG: FAD-dependent oxidoreductase [Actinomycetota bacterium]|nr:FAD-dependent oxidoreductase [Actinomycetota bacterium]
MNDEAQAVIVGGGVAGASIAYHLTKMGWRDVVLVERADLTSGSTFHSAGLVGQLRSTVTLTRMMMYGVELYRRLKDETGVDPGWHEVGSLRLASSPERIEELSRLSGWGKTFGLPLEIVSTEEALRLFPLFDPDGVIGAAYLPTDGWLEPAGLTYALAEGAKSRGATIMTGTRVHAVTVERGRVRGVETDLGPIRAGVVVNAGGIYAHEIGQLAGVEVPVVPMAHQFLVTKPLEGVRRDFPTMRDPDLLVYFREDAGGLVAGGYERDPAPWGMDGIPADFNNRLLDEDWPRFEPLSEGALRRVPALESAEIVKMINGPEAFTPDGEFILGESEVRGFYVAAGFCAHGIAGAGGVGRIVAEWIVDGEPSMDAWKMDIRRFGAHYRSRRYALARATEIYSTYYDIHYPGEERQSARGLRLPPTYERLAALGCEFGEKSGWERPNWFRRNENEEFERFRPRGWAGQHWSTAIPAEHLATRERAGLFDETSFSKIELTGPGACEFLQRLCDNDVDRPVGAITYTSMLNGRGGIECDFTVTRLEEERFLIVTGTAFGNHDLGWIRRHQPEDGSVQVRDVTSSLACLGLWGPRARDVLSACSADDLAFPYMRARRITVGDVPCLALRVTYVGELGWELYPPMEFAVRLWDTLMEAGEPHGLVPAGYRAIDSMRLEKGYRVWSSDITPEDNPYEAGLGFAVKLDKPVEFIGKQALERTREEGPSRELCCLVLGDLRSVALGNEPVRSGDAVVARVTSGGQGYSVGASIAYAYMPISLAEPGTAVAVEVFGEWIPAIASAEPLFDPKGERIRS